MWVLYKTNGGGSIGSIRDDLGITRDGSPVGGITYYIQPSPIRGRDSSNFRNIEYWDDVARGPRRHAIQTPPAPPT